MPSYVYVITHEPSTRHYVGKTNNPAYRWYVHKYTCRPGVNRSGGKSYLYNAIRKHGESEFTFQVIEEHETDAQAYESEVFWIEFLRSNVDGYGFNLDSGGTGGKRLSASTKAKLSEAGKRRVFGPETRAKMSASGKGRKFSDEHKARIGASNKGRKMSEEHRAKLSALMTGVPLSDEHKAKLSAAALGKKLGPAPQSRRDNISAAKMGKKMGPQTEEHKRKRAESTRATLAAKKAAAITESTASESTQT